MDWAGFKPALFISAWRYGLHSHCKDNLGAKIKRMYGSHTLANALQARFIGTLLRNFLPL